MPINTNLFRWAILTRKVGLTDLVIGVQSKFIGRSMHARLQVCVSVTICATLVNIQSHKQHLTSLYENSASWADNSSNNKDILVVTIIYVLFKRPKLLTPTKLSLVIIWNWKYEGCQLIDTRPCAPRRVTVAPACYDLACMAGRLGSLSACWA